MNRQKLSINASILIATALLLLGCSHLPPAIAVHPGAMGVKIFFKRADVPAQCRALQVITESDGIAETKSSKPGHLYEGTRRAYDGTVERVFLRLRNRVVEIGGNALYPLVATDPEFSSHAPPVVFTFDCKDCGYVEQISAVAYSCSQALTSKSLGRS